MNVEITDLSRGGAGVGKSPDGQIAFVPLTLPGDRVRVRVVKARKNYLECEMEEIILPSPSRVAPRCAVFGKCGGCAWQHVPYELQFKTKTEGVRHALKRVQVEAPNSFQSYAADQPYQYRNRIQLRGEGDQIGFFARGSRNLVPIERCEVAREELNARLTSIREKGLSHAGPYKVEIDVLPDHTVREAWNQRHAALGFRQVNDSQNGHLQNWIAERISSGRILYDLYGGSGNLSLHLAARMKITHCVDVSSPKMRLSNQPENFFFHSSDVSRWLKSAMRRPPHAPALEASAIIDPPRDGLSENFPIVANAVKKLNIREIIAVGCDPDSWARDVRHWIDEGFHFEAAAAFDFFPQTPHIESVALLRL